MALATSKLTELPLRNCSLPLTSHSPSLKLLLFSQTPKPSFHHHHLLILRPFSSLRTNQNPRTTRHQTPKPKPRSPRSTPWLNKWSSPPKPNDAPGKARKSNGRDRIDGKQTGYATQNKDSDNDKGQSSIDRIVLRLRNLGLGSDDEEEEDEEGGGGGVMAVTGDERLEDLLRREWVRPNVIFAEDNEGGDDVLPWEKEENEKEGKNSGAGTKRRTVKAPSLAELTVEDEELRRLRRVGMHLRERISVAKAGITQAVLQKIHDKWRKEELVRLKFHEELACDMKTAHEIVEICYGHLLLATPNEQSCHGIRGLEHFVIKDDSFSGYLLDEVSGVWACGPRRTGGLVIWRSGSVMVVYRGTNYEGPSSKSQPLDRGEALFVPDVSSADRTTSTNVNGETSTPEKSEPVLSNLDCTKNMTEEEAEYNSLLDSLGPRFHEWWGTGILPVDADLLPQTVPGYKTPFRLLPTGMRSHLTNAEMTNLRKLARSLPCHFALGIVHLLCLLSLAHSFCLWPKYIHHELIHVGRNRNHQGLAAAIIKLWEKSLVAKIAVKRGIQNTNNKLMSEEIKKLTGGTLLQRNKYYIVIFRGKDFLPPSVAAALAERQDSTKQIQDVEEKIRIRTFEATPSSEIEGQAPAGTLAEFYEAQSRWGRDVSAEERKKMIEEASKAKQARLVRRIEHKVAVAQAKKLRAEKLLSKVEASMIPAGPDYDQETITEEERTMFRRVGLRMKAYLPLGIRGVFDGVIENMHLHWKHRELVKLISKQKTLAFVEDTARLLEFESGGILVAIERVPKGFAIIYYRGKNYRRPISLRPRNLLTKAKALKRSVAMQRHEALSQHISELESTIEQMKKEIGVSQDAEDGNIRSSEDHSQFDLVSEFTQSEDEDTGIGSDGDYGFDEDSDWEADEESDSSFEIDDDTASKNS
ncbi:hypothetical protein JRO89_XS13G0015700 [Xanthoceras sorbifolium]|uniref:CRM domain-containing protein n=1 Tax=Xanthoceras sorbifolium TaxID=99658 RepID=A0ABQ8H602_9ROSI|nr:hypothetical protein JRO89_XS13G0015700 [Xanthoceras sorbifolium]